MDPQPENKPTLDIATLLPILLAVFSLFGILVVFMIGRFNANRPVAPAEDTPTPFKYQLIGTEPGISTAETTTAEIVNGEPGSGTVDEPGFGTSAAPSGDSTTPPNLGLVVTAQQGGVSGSGSSQSTSVPKTKSSSSSILTAAGNATDPVIILKTNTPKATQATGFIERTYTPTRTPRSTITVTPSRTRPPTLTKATVGPSTNTPTRTPTNASSAPTQPPLLPSSEEYDDTHPFLKYEGWSQVADASAHDGTLHVSNTVGSTVSFRFTGRQLRLTFQGSGSLGEVSIDIGGLVFMLDESNETTEWVSADLVYGTYTVTITHATGGSVNIDSIFIPVFNTPTPSATPTPTPTSQ
jgi:hypothetical protein